MYSFNKNEVRKLNKLTTLNLVRTQKEHQLKVIYNDQTIGIIDGGNPNEGFYPVFWPESVEYQLGADKLKTIATILDAIAKPTD